MVAHEEQMGVSINWGTPSHHPNFDGTFPFTKTNPLLGYPIYGGVPIEINIFPDFDEKQRGTSWRSLRARMQCALAQEANFLQGGPILRVKRMDRRLKNEMGTHPTFENIILFDVWRVYSIHYSFFVAVYFHRSLQNIT